MVQSSYINKLVRSESLQNLDYMYPNSIVNQGRDAFSMDGKVWAIPFLFTIRQLLFCNPDIIDPPESDWILMTLKYSVKKLSVEVKFRQPGIIFCIFFNSVSDGFLENQD